MRATTSRVLAVLVAGGFVLSACGDGGDRPSEAASGATPTTPASAPPTSADDQLWRERVDESCAHFAPILSVPPPAGDRASLEAYVTTFRDIHDTRPWSVEEIGLPAGPGRTAEDLDAIVVSAEEALDRAAVGAEAGDVDATLDGVNSYTAHVGSLASAYAAAGQSCGPADAARAAGADLNVTIVSPWQIQLGFDSVWVSQTRTDTVARIDPDTGEILASIDMPSEPFKLQPADGRMLVRTADTYEAVDPTTNAVVDSLRKADVGPNANRSWAVDGALWICDGQRLHRYDPATLEPLVVVDLGLECGQPYATDDLAIALSYDEDPGDSGTARAAFIDPSTNAVLGTVDLAADSSVPVVLEDVVFFPPQLGSQATVVDRSTWTVIAAPDLGRFIDGGSQPAFDGSHIYVIADKPTGTVAVIDPSTFEIVDTLETLATAPSLNSLAGSSGVVWAVNNSGGVVQRFDTAG